MRLWQPEKFAETLVLLCQRAKHLEVAAAQVGQRMGYCDEVDAEEVALQLALQMAVVL